MSAKSVPSAIHPDIERVLLDEAKLKARIQELGSQISRDYAGRRLTLVGILKGSVLFMGDLMRSISSECTIDFMAVSSYAGVSSTGAVRLNLDLREPAAGKDLLIVEDVVDTGLTLQYLQENLRAHGPSSLEICALLDKPDCRKTKVSPKYVGFTIGNEFVVGFGLDFNEKYRNLPYLGVLKKEKQICGK